jgi:hypothetical protein
MGMRNMPKLNARVLDRGIWNPRWAIHDFRDPTGEIAEWGRKGATIQEILRGFPRSHVRSQFFHGNLLLNEGINALWTLVAGTGATLFDNGHAYIGVGDSSTAASATQTGLLGTTNNVYKPMDTSYPTFGTSQYATWRATYGTGDANFTWNEITVANGSSDAAVNLNRKIQSMGLKSGSLSRVASLQISLS